MLNKEQIRQIQILKQGEHKSDSEIARLMGVNRRSVVKYANDKKYTENTQFLKEYTKIKNKEANDILELVRSDSYIKIATDIVDLFDKDSLQAERDTRGIRSLTALLGNTVDKTIAYERLQLDKRKVDIAERTLELKEQELQARLDNPDAFTTVTILNDSEEVNDWYRDNGTNTAYSKN